MLSTKVISPPLSPSLPHSLSQSFCVSMSVVVVLVCECVFLHMNTHTELCLPLSLFPFIWFLLVAVAGPPGCLYPSCFLSQTSPSFSGRPAPFLSHPLHRGRTEKKSVWSARIELSPNPTSVAYNLCDQEHFPHPSPALAPHLKTGVLVASTQSSSEALIS